MIQISLSSAVILYSAILGLIALSIWIYTEIYVRRTHNVLEKQFLWKCVFCGYVYLDEAAEKLSCCPRCESYNSVEDAHARYIKSRVTQTEQPEDPYPDPDRRNTSHRKRPHQRRRGPRKR